MRKKFVAWSLLAALAAGSLTACGESAGTGTGTEGGTVSAPPLASDAGSGTGTGTDASAGTGTGLDASASASTAP